MRKRQHSDGNSQSSGNPRPAPYGCTWCLCWRCTWNEERGEGFERPSHTTKMESFETTEECLQITLQEVISWGQNFEKMMSTSTGRNVFREFLRSEYSEENLLFYLACEDLKNEQNSKVVEEKARTIYEDYVSILSPKEVSLDSRVREAINRNLKEPNSNMYDEAQLQIYTLMHRDSFPRFLNSPVYKSLLAKMSEIPSDP
ncbi:regulator of G-protein signaling 17 [Erpetoichthys calabaricus]|uniref:Regulator of G protein signaling 17 n=1 Tax=Erpetoichthys calabaricus TaxID=27687 RepID=A0A8C4X3Y3_ERPCA|nr:regulator of G-protein signaling 17 [Erpetoichthys calabaricus]